MTTGLKMDVRPN